MKLSAVFFGLILLTSQVAFANGPVINSSAPNTRIGLRAVEETKARPNLPGDLIIEFGFNFLSDDFSYEADSANFSVDREASTGFWGSKVVNFYYSHNMFIGGESSGFTFNPGLGLALEKFSFDEDITLTVNQFNGDTEITDISSIGDVKKTKLALTYLDIPLEFRYHFNKTDYARGFRLAVGVKAGLLLGSHTKLKYENNEETVKLKDKREFNLNPIRFGAIGRVGVGGFNLYYFQSISELFKDGETPGFGPAVNPFQVGISLIGF
ncbi:MAG: porin family protein [Cyclobacteriaceae bacterium]